MSIIRDRKTANVIKSIEGTAEAKSVQTGLESISDGLDAAKRLIRVDQIYSRKDRQIHFVPTKRPTKTKDKFHKTVLVVRRIISDKGHVAGIEVDIKSRALADVLLEIFADVDSLKLNKTPPEAQPELLFHARKELNERLKKLKECDPPNHNLANDIETVFHFVAEHFGDSTANLASLLEHGEITYDLLWALFPPKIPIFTMDNALSEPEVFNCRHGSYERTPQGEEYYLMTGQIVSHDGRNFGIGTKSFKIPKFEGSKKIDSLPSYPLSCHRSEETIRQQLIERGRKFSRFISFTCQEHVGMGVTEKEGPMHRTEIKFEATGRVILDPVAFRMYNPNMRLLLNPMVQKILKPEELVPEELLICSHRILGFSLAKKEWGAFAVSTLKEIVWNEAAFNKLKIEPKHRDIICSLVKGHRNDTDAFDDIIKGKGGGLIGLLSGSPGVGKTLTAEVVAEVTHRPLYMTSAGELGTDVARVDSRLQMVLDISKRWGCVLLIDEVDVFLQARNELDLVRNAFVSVWLRRLEYFSGILIMTTNREMGIDPAFQSRIHFKIRYPDLTEESRTEVWKTFLANVPQGVMRPNLSDEDVKQLAILPLNGREAGIFSSHGVKSLTCLDQIKNAISSAFLISRSRDKALTVDSIREILNITVNNLI